MKDETPLNDLVKIGAACDWITPVWALLQNFAHGSHADFGIVAGAGFTIGDIKRLLRSNGIDVWGLVYTVDFDMLMFSVTQEQARLADDVLNRAGVPVLYSPAGIVDNEPAQPKPAHTMGNSFQMGDMAIVPARSIWGVLWGLVVRLIG